MDIRRNEDRRPARCGVSYNLIHSIEDIGDESGSITEPVSLAEIKDYLRLEGFNGDGSTGLAVQTPLEFSMTGFSVQSDLLKQDNVIVTQVMREGLGYKVVSAGPIGRQAQVDYTTGTVTFESTGSAVDVEIQYGIQGASTTVDDFDFDDSFLLESITSSRERIEVHTGSHLIPKRLSVVLTNLCGLSDIPGPVTGDITWTDVNGIEIPATDIKLIGSSFPQIKQPLQEFMKLEYDAGYSVIPKGLKIAIMKQVAYDYEHRGDETDDPGLCKGALMSIKPYIKLSAFG